MIHTNSLQPEFDFESKSPINTEKLGGQNKKLFEYLSKGNTIHCQHEARQELKIGYLNSRISDLIKAGVKVYKRYIKINDTTVKEYSLNEFN